MGWPAVPGALPSWSSWWEHHPLAHSQQLLEGSVPAEASFHPSLTVPCYLGV